MKIMVRFFTSLREITGKREDEIKSSSSSLTLEKLLNILSEKYGQQFTDYLYNDKGNVRTYIQILVNGRDIKAMQRLQTRLKEGDTVAIFPPVGGG